MTTDTPSLMELGRRLHANQCTLEQALAWMREGSCSVILNWSEDDGPFWECSWIVGGERFTGFQTDIRKAVLQAINRCIERYANEDDGEDEE